MFAEVVPNAPVTSAFHYRIPPELESTLRAGHLVQISFGPQLLQGIVVGITDELPDGLPESSLKAIDALIDVQPVLTRDQLDLAYFMANRTLASLADCLFCMVPPGLAKQGDTEYDLLDSNFDAESDTQFRLIELIKKRGPLRGKQIDRALPRRNWKAAAAGLVKRGVLSRRPILQPPSVRPKQIRTARLLIPPAQVPAAQFRLRYSPPAADLLEYLFSLYPGQPALPDLLQILGLTEAQLQPLVERNWIAITEAEPVLTAAYPPEVIQKWIEKYGDKFPEDTAILRQLIASPVAPLSQLPITNYQLLTTTVQQLNAQDLIHYSVNPRRVLLNLPGHRVLAEVKQLRKPSKRAAVLEFLAKHNKPVPVSWVSAETGATTTTLNELAELDLVDLGDEEVMRDPLAGKVFVPATPPPFTADQRAAWEAIETAFALLGSQSPVSSPPFLLHGVTGSGKTELYLRATARALELGRRSIILVPEIALTPQTVQRFASRFPSRVAIIHSQLSEGERYDTWRRCRSGAVDILIGARSALFVPLPDIGLIVLDEEHDEAYQQDPPASPFYHAREMAVEYARRLNAICLLGTATPDVITYAKARRGDYRLLELQQRVLAHTDYLAQVSQKLKRPTVFQPVQESSAQSSNLPPVSIVDMRNELRAGNRSIFSRSLQTALTQTLERGEQAILFLNRRGQSTYVFCRDCGTVLECSRCETPLTYHGSETNLQCHHCGAVRRQPSACPKCKSPRLKYFGAGTELIERELKSLFPNITALRWDRDTTKQKGAHEIILAHFREHRADVLIGTQMIAKGLDLPLVTLVGVVSADVGLNLPDYRATERVFQILTQVAGRAGRSALGGRVIIQSYQPDHYAILAAAQHDSLGFMDKELTLRKKLGYPPYAHLVRFTYQHHKADKAEQEAHRLADLLRAKMRRAEARSTVLIGPAPCFFEKIDGSYRWQIVLRGPKPAELARGLQLKDWQVEVDPMSLL